MNEIKEAENFSLELDKILAGKAVAADLDPEMAADLAFAARLSALDHSAESRMKNPAKLKILGKARENFLLGLLRRAGVRPEVLAYCLLALLVGAPAVNMIPSDLPKRRRSTAVGGLAPISSLGNGGGGGLNLIRSNPNYRGAIGPRGDGPQGLDGTKKAGQNAGDAFSRTGSALGGLNAAANEQIPTGGTGFDGNGQGGAGSNDKSPGGSKSVGESLAFIEAKERMYENMRLEYSKSRTATAKKKAHFTMAQVREALMHSPGRAASAAPKLSGTGSSFSAGRTLEGAGNGWNGDVTPSPTPAPADREAYAYTIENPFQTVKDHPLSTFSIDVDAASYSNVRRFLNASAMPPADAVRVEEFINYFRYSYPEPQGEHPFSITTELAACPWNEKHKLVRVGIKGQSIVKENLPPNNLVFLIDTSGSMMGADRLELVKQGLRMLVGQLRKEDRISIVTYAGSAGLVLPPTSGSKKEDILQALGNLQAGGSTAGGEGINLAYKVAADGFMKKGNNRVILATDGDFNVGVTSDGELTRLIEEKREHGVFLTVLGVGTGNVQDSKMESLADKGNGNYAYLDDVMEAQKVLVKEMGATLVTIAKDVKIQVEFNPSRVSSYKLLGYENRMLQAEDFNNDKKDAGELGAGGTVTALYEVVPAGVTDEALPGVDALKYQKAATPEPSASDSKELLTVKFRYKKPAETTSRLITRPLLDEERAWSEASPDLKFSAAAAGFGMMLRHSNTKGNLTYDKVRAMAQEGLGKDEDGYRSEMVRLVAKAKLLDQKER